MATNKIIMKTQDEFISDFVPSYSPIYGLFLNGAKAYSEEVGKVNFNRVEAVADIRARRYSPKDTEMKQIGVKSGAKSFKKYFFANQYVQSLLQSQEDVDSVVAQVLDEHSRQFDDLLFLGDGTSAATVQNNGLFWSGDANYVLNSSDSIDAPTGDAADYYATLMTLMESAAVVPGKKAVLVYGSTAQSRLNTLFPNSTSPVKEVLEKAMGSDAQIVKVPSDVALGNVNGWIIVSMDHVKLHHCGLPKIDASGVNEEKKYVWTNFLMGSCMLEVLKPSAIIRQPLTFS